MVKVVTIVIYRGKAFLPTLARIKGNGFNVIEPVTSTNADSESLVATIERLIAVGHPIIEPRGRHGKDPILVASGARDWKELAAEGASYTIVWLENQLNLDTTRVNEEGELEDDPSKTKKFPVGTTVAEIVDAILVDASSRSDLGLSANKNRTVEH